MAEPFDFTAAALERALRGQPLGRPLHFFDSIGSTNAQGQIPIMWDKVTFGSVGGIMVNHLPPGSDNGLTEYDRWSST